MTSLNERGQLCARIEQIKAELAQTCTTVLNQLFSNGLTNALNNVVNLIQTRNEADWSAEQLVNYIELSDYAEQLQGEKILAVALEDVALNLSTDDTTLVQNYQLMLENMFAYGGTLISLLFIALAIYSFFNILSNYTFVKRSIHLINFKRLSEDNTTRFLLKRFIDF